jgi:hypothetical protein
MLKKCSMLKKMYLFSLFLFLATPLYLFSQPSIAYTPLKESTERKEILGELRAHLKKSFKVDAVFAVGHFRVKDGWAWIETNPRSPDGKNAYEPIAALLRLEKGKWKIIDFAPGECTGDEEDSPDCDPKHLFTTFISKYKAPREIFPKASRK